MLATSGGDGFVRLWDRKTGAELGAINRRGKPAFSDDGKLLAIGSTYHAEVWRLVRDSSAASQDQKLTLDGPIDMIFLPYNFLPTFDSVYADDFSWSPHSLSFTPGGGSLLLSIGSTVIWDWTERRKTQLAIPNGHAFLAFSPDGRTIWILPGVT